MALSHFEGELRVALGAIEPLNNLTQETRMKNGVKLTVHWYDRKGEKRFRWGTRPSFVRRNKGYLPGSVPGQARSGVIGEIEFGCLLPIPVTLVKSQAGRGSQVDAMPEQRCVRALVKYCHEYELGQEEGEEEPLWRSCEDAMVEEEEAEDEEEEAEDEEEEAEDEEEEAEDEVETSRPQRRRRTSCTDL